MSKSGDISKELRKVVKCSLFEKDDGVWKKWSHFILQLNSKRCNQKVYENVE
jgi:hypothetical protein